MDSDTTEILSQASTYTEFMEWSDQVSDPDASDAVENDGVFMQKLLRLIVFVAAKMVLN
uniref:Uncharacterized protein n=1 Tax=Tetranychus urticae TaxID=32264 RepID=T1KIY1_TETUR